ncbi:MAG: DUF4352 domain-containing protein, partial [Chloroflexi bacterium]|nr:DUF4352 domain-containing protein [Chloroflexota bacterium]
TQVPVSAVGSFELRDEEGYQYPWTTIPNAPAAALNGTVGPGGKLAGSLAYEVTAGKRYLLHYSGLLFSTDAAIIELGEL